MNLFTYGRSVTMAMQHMKSVDPAFDAWWQSHQEWIATDPLMRYFNDRRVDVIHAGELQTVTSAHVRLIDDNVMRELNKHAPPNTISTFFGDQLGGNGWEVRLLDGSTEKIYFEVPEHVAKIELILPDAPTEHNEKPLPSSIAGIGGTYIDALTALVDEFVAHFGQ